MFPIYRMPYNESNDIALVKVTGKPKVTPICLYKELIEVHVDVFLPILTIFRDGRLVQNNYHTMTLQQDKCMDANKNATKRDFCVEMHRNKCLLHSIKGVPVQYLDDNTNTWYLMGLTKYCQWKSQTDTLMADRVYDFLKWIESNIS